MQIPNIHLHLHFFRLKYTAVYRLYKYCVSILTSSRKPSSTALSTAISSGERLSSWPGGGFGSRFVDSELPFSSICLLATAFRSAKLA